MPIDWDTLQEKIGKILNDLGNTPNEIALKLNELNIKGYKSQSRNCPLANKIKKDIYTLYPEIHNINISVQPTYVMITHIIDGQYHPPTIQLNLPLQHFIANFDMGFYDFLKETQKI